MREEFGHALELLRIASQLAPEVAAFLRAASSSLAPSGDTVAVELARILPDPGASELVERRLRGGA